jgi:hypothetical protein
MASSRSLVVGCVEGGLGGMMNKMKAPNDRLTTLATNKRKLFFFDQVKLQ